MQSSATILKHPELNPAVDYAFLREAGLKHIENLGSAMWTDYNVHDPGIMLLELLCYAITDISYRISFEVKDLLAKQPDQETDFDRQAFYSARKILHINPWTISDFRKLLIDIEGIKNAWLTCRACPCDDIFLYANCKKSILQYEGTEHRVRIKGMYDVSVEFEDEEGIGDLNSGKIKYNFSFKNGEVNSTALLEMRLPSWQAVQEAGSTYEEFRNKTAVVTNVKVEFISGNKFDDQDIQEADLPNALRKSLYATLLVAYAPDKADLSTTKTIPFIDIPVKILFSHEGDKKNIKLADISNAIKDKSKAGILARYLAKLQTADHVMKEVEKQLHTHRNLSEDFCKIQAVAIEEIAVCADLDVDATAEIEAVLAQAYYLIDQYLSPDIKFYSLQELLAAKVPVEEIFDGPALENGFINNDQLASTNLKETIYSSDIINLLMDIPGVIAIRNFVLARYNEEGLLVQSEPWSMNITPAHQPRLYIEGSKFLVFKNGLPFLPDRLELSDTISVIRGQHSQPKYSSTDNDLPVPVGTWYDLKQYSPLQNSLPLTYGVGEVGLPSTASVERVSQAKQLKCYLLFYEQLLFNYVQQLLHAEELFSVDASVKQTYFSSLLKENIPGIEELIDSGLDENELHNLIETESTFLDRRNRFLDHLLARFAEQFSDYAAMLYSFTSSKAIADHKLIHDKVDFITDIPFMTANRARSFDYKLPAKVCHSSNVAGLATRIRRLLGMRELQGYFEVYEANVTTAVMKYKWRLVNYENEILLTSSKTYNAASLNIAEANAAPDIEKAMKWIIDATHYKFENDSGFTLHLLNDASEEIASQEKKFSQEADAEKFRNDIISFANTIHHAEKIYIVEHLLLRPRNKPAALFPDGDPLLSVCIPPDCSLCGEEDPYSFRITIVMNGEEGIANQSIDFRRFAEKTIRTEVPAHLGVKICWVDTKQMTEFEIKYCSWLSELANEKPGRVELHKKLRELLLIFSNLKTVYPAASLHDCVDGNDENRTFLGRTII